MRVYINEDSSVHYIGNEAIATDVDHIIEINVTKQQLSDYSNLFLENGVLVERSVDVKIDLSVEQVLFRKFLGIYSGYDRTVDGLKYQTTAKSFDTIVSEQALAIKTKATAETKNIHLMLSGGLDSTLAFYAMVAQNAALTVHYDEFSEAEYPRLIENIEAGKFQNITAINHTKTPTNFATIKDKIVLTGELGGQIFGSDKTVADYYDQRNMAYKLVIDQRLWRDIKPTTDKILRPKDTATVAQWLWCVNFIFNWHSTNTKIYNSYGIKTEELLHFFDSDDFQKYAISYQTSNAEFNQNTYKKPIRDYIFSKNSDENYYKNKIKINSLRLASYANKK